MKETERIKLLFFNSIPTTNTKANLCEKPLYVDKTLFFFDSNGVINPTL